MGLSSIVNLPSDIAGQSCRKCDCGGDVTKQRTLKLRKKAKREANAKYNTVRQLLLLVVVVLRTAVGLRSIPTALAPVPPSRLFYSQIV